MSYAVPDSLPKTWEKGVVTFVKIGINKRPLEATLFRTLQKRNSKMYGLQEGKRSTSLPNPPTLSIVALRANGGAKTRPNFTGFVVVSRLRSTVCEDTVLEVLLVIFYHASFLFMLRAIVFTRCFSKTFWSRYSIGGQIYRITIYVQTSVYAIPSSFSSFGAVD